MRGKVTTGTTKRYGKINNKKAHEHRKGGHELGRKIRDFAQATPSLRRGKR